ncbi:hypothetical protein [Lysobacter enzymogenes]|uniref:hypothetical protein n=1 Tax=Lysobacter enzymogenes TaxID=69 RepID=UPI000F4CD7EF|nr:hypothetical protein [Lysobacter enzymogenes]
MRSERKASGLKALPQERKALSHEPAAVVDVSETKYRGVGAAAIIIASLLIGTGENIGACAGAAMSRSCRIRAFDLLDRQRDDGANRSTARDANAPFAPRFATHARLHLRRPTESPRLRTCRCDNKVVRR